MNHIFVISNNLYRLEAFKKYYNIFGLPTVTKIHVILDDRYKDYDVSNIDDFFTIHYASDVLRSILPLLDEPTIAKNILDIYGVAIKWLVFPYVHKVLCIPKAMMMDDDVFLLAPLDHYFKYDYTYYNESAIGNMSTRVEKTMNVVYGDLVDIESLRRVPYWSINSGQLIHTENKHYMNFINRAFSKDVYVLLYEGYMKYKNKPEYNRDGRSLGGKFWCIEQNVYTIYYRYLVNLGYQLKKYDSDVRLFRQHLPENWTFKNLKTLPAYVHFVLKDKTQFYSQYAHELDKVMSGDYNIKPINKY